MESTTVSAPGKVLFAGGYLVLDQQHKGLVFGLNARIHVHIQQLESDDHDLALANQVSVRSPQFKDAVWVYSYSTDQDHIRLEQVQSSQQVSANPFVETTLHYALTYLHHLPAQIDGSWQIIILADDDYYSQLATKSTGGFRTFETTIRDTHKTGLGSSAALVTALTAALLLHLIPYQSKSDMIKHRKVIHNLAQAAHCAAQGKVGSGFDVAAAVYGSCLYTRFSPSTLFAVGDATSSGFGKRLRKCVEDLDLERPWDAKIMSDAVQLPKSLRLVMCDVDCGSETPGMVKKVLAWRKEKVEEAALLWNALQQGTEDLCVELERLTHLEGISADHGFQELRDVILTIRSLVREMSLKSGVPIEPPLQTRLLDECSAVPGVIGGVCPGAGGYDALALLVKNDESVVAELAATLEGWKSVEDPQSGARIGNVRLLGVKQDDEGLRREGPAKISEWIRLREETSQLTRPL